MLILARLLIVVTTVSTRGNQSLSEKKYRSVYLPIERRITRLHHGPYQALEEQDFARIYDCGSVTGFIKPGQ